MDSNTLSQENQSDWLTETPGVFVENDSTGRPLLTVSQLKYFKLFILSSYIIYPLIGVLAGIANLFLISAVIKFKSLRSSTNVLIVSLAFADLMNSPAFIILKLRNYIRVINDNEVYLKVILSFAQSLVILSCNMSVISYFLIAIERWLAVTYPLRFKAMVTIKKTITVAVCSWIYGITSNVTIVSYYTWKKPMSFYSHPFFLGDLLPQPAFIYLTPFHFYTFLSVTVIMYVNIIIQMKRRTTAFSGDGMESTMRQNTKKVTQMTLIMLGVFLLFLVPWSIISTSNSYQLLVRTTLPGLIGFQVFLYLVYCNSFMNVFIYAWRSRVFRRAFKEMLCSLRRRPRAESNSSLSGSTSVTSRATP